MATISQKEWNRYIARLRNINEKAEEEFADWVVDNLGYAHIERQKLIDHAYAIASKYGEASSALSAEMYDAVAELSGAVVPAAVPVEVQYSDVAKTVNGIIKNTGSEKILTQGIGRLVKRAGTDTTLSNAYRDRPKGKGSKRKHSGAQVAWVPSGDTCPFCMMLASKGWVNQTQWGANSHSEHIHANCDCTYAVRFDNDSNIEGYDPDYYKKMYDEAEGSTREEKLNYMRREQYAEEKDAIEQTPFKVQNAVGAMARRFYIESETPLKDTGLYLKPGTYVEGVKVIASGRKINDVERLINEYKLQNGSLTKADDWFKVRGRAEITDGTNDYGRREVHWYQAKNIGKVEFKFPSNKKQI